MRTLRYRGVMQTRTLFISAGHSDTDPGASGNGYTESDIVLEFRDLLAEYLLPRVALSQDGQGGENLPLRTAAKMAHMHDVAVEFHCNAFNGKVSGVETLSSSANMALGSRICGSIHDVMGIPNRGAKDEKSGQHSRLAFVSKGGGIIVELFFIDRRSDLETYLSRQDAVVAAVGDVLIDAVCDEVI